MLLSSLTGFCDAGVAPIDFPVAPAEAMPKVIFWKFFMKVISIILGNNLVVCSVSIVV